jgi:hypothetical protein
MHRCVEGCDFDLCQVCLVPAMVSWSFASSRFKQRYDATATPQYQHQVVGAVHGLVQAHAARHGVTAAAVHEFFRRVEQNAAHAGGLVEFFNEVQHVAVRMWTSAEQLDGKELCWILNEALREDEAVDHTAVISRALNAFCVRRQAGGGPSLQTRWPASNETVRGGGLPRRHRPFFTIGKRYRVPMFLATSGDRPTADAFMQRQAEEPVLWTFRFDPALRCNHVNFIDRTDNTAGSEAEFLFSPFSAFEVLSVLWSAQPHWTRPHEIVVKVAPDNTAMEWPEDLPLAPWA